VPAASEMLVACLPRCLPRLGGQEAGRRDERGRASHPPGRAGTYASTGPSP